MHTTTAASVAGNRVVSPAAPIPTPASTSPSGSSQRASLRSPWRPRSGWQAPLVTLATSANVPTAASE